AALLAGAFVPAWSDGSWTATAGAALAAAAPLVFLLAFRRRRGSLNGHPLIVSVLSGLGCVVVMVAETRAGPAPGGPLFLSLFALAVWMLWQRGQRSRSEQR